MVNYPTEYDNDGTLYNVTDNIDDVLAVHHNALKDAIIATQQALGKTGAFNFTTDAEFSSHTGGNEHIDWTAGSAGTIHTDNYIEYSDTLVEAVITAEIVEGQSIDNAIDALIATHKGLPNDHHIAYTDTDAEAVITAELVDGQSIDNAIDSLISTHASDDDAHHVVFEPGDEDAAIATHAALATGVHGVGASTVASVADLHSEAHVLATTGPHTGTLPLADLAAGVAGDIIIRGAADWEALVKSTDDKVLTLVSGYPAWADSVGGAHDLDSATHSDISTITDAIGAMLYQAVSGTWSRLTPAGTVGHTIVCSNIDGSIGFAELSHTVLGDIGSNAHSVIDTHLGSTSNPHSVDWADVSAGHTAGIHNGFAIDTEGSNIDLNTGNLIVYYVDQDYTISAGELHELDGLDENVQAHFDNEANPHTIVWADVSAGHTAAAHNTISVTALSDVTGVGSGIIISSAERTGLHVKYALTEDLIANEITVIQAIDDASIDNTKWDYIAALSEDPQTHMSAANPHSGSAPTSHAMSSHSDDDTYNILTTGTARFESAQVVDSGDALAPVVVGSSTGVHIEIDGDDIQAKSTATLAGTLYLQRLGGTFEVGATTYNLKTVPAGAADYDKFLALDTDALKYRTGSELLSDIGAASTGDLSTHESDTSTHGVAQVANHAEIASQISTHAALGDEHHTEAHALATTGPHTGTLPLADLEVGVSGDIIIRGAADWEILNKGSDTDVLTLVSGEPAWVTQGAPGVHDIITGHNDSGLTIGNVIIATGATSFAWGELSHTDLGDIGTDSHATIDAHIDAANPHSGSAATSAIPDVAVYDITNTYTIAFGINNSGNKSNAPISVAANQRAKKDSTTSVSIHNDAAAISFQWRVSTNGGSSWTTITDTTIVEQGTEVFTDSTDRVSNSPGDDIIYRIETTSTDWDQTAQTNPNYQMGYVLENW